MTTAPALQFPFQGTYPIEQPFGPTTNTFEPSYGGYPHFHTGIDYGVPMSTPIDAANPGTIEVPAYDASGYGNYIEDVGTNGITTLYGHLSQILVKTGEVVTAGEEIGLSGSTGNSTGPHLHFGVLDNGTYVDPTPFLSRSTSNNGVPLFKIPVTPPTSTPSNPYPGTTMSDGPNAFPTESPPNVPNIIGGLLKLPTIGGVSIGGTLALVGLGLLGIVLVYALVRESDK